MLGYLFLGSAEPACLDAADADDDGKIVIADAIGILGYLFLGSAAPPAPGPDVCGADPTAECAASVRGRLPVAIGATRTDLPAPRGRGWPSLPRRLCSEPEPWQERRRPGGGAGEGAGGGGQDLGAEPSVTLPVPGRESGP